jgi:dynein intermediate chain
MMKHLKTIREEEDHDADGAINSFDMLQMSPSPFGGSPDLRIKTKKQGGPSVRGSFIGGSVIGDEYAPQAPETEQQKAGREKKELMEQFQIMSKEDSKVQMKTKEFDDFFMKTSRILERALDNDFDVIGDFFADDDEDLDNLYKQ